MHNLERIDASRGWLGVVPRIPAFLRTPHLDKIATLLDSLHDAALEETVRLEVGIVLLHEHFGGVRKTASPLPAGASFVAAAHNAECRSQRGVSWFATQMRDYFMGEKSSGRM